VSERVEMSEAKPLLHIRGMTTVFPTRRGLVRAVTGLDLSLGRGELLGLVGESGCGKSVSMLSVLRLVAYPGRIVSGQILLEGRDVLKLSGGELREVRGKQVGMIFQDPMTTLNPAFRVGEQIAESLRIHRMLNGSVRLPWPLNRPRLEAERKRVVELLDEVGIAIPWEARKRYPHEFSGGMQQRALIAIAVSCQPKLLLADEPTTALDVTIQAQIVDLLRKLNRDHGTSIILVTHNLGLAATFCQNIAVMYAGRLVEKGPTDAVIEAPKHPYTRGLLDCIPRIGHARETLRPIRGNVPDLADLPSGCAFHPRCDRAYDACKEGEVPLIELADGRQVRCLLYV
jgi:oligopeptide/dipeptide ABC transporter ATP-binding protein